MSSLLPGPGFLLLPWWKKGKLRPNPFDKDGNEITLDQTKVDAERTAINKLAYKSDRRQDYPDFGTQLDYIYHNGIDKWKTDIVDPVKKKYPKP